MLPSLQDSIHKDQKDVHALGHLDGERERTLTRCFRVRENGVDPDGAAVGFPWLVFSPFRSRATSRSQASRSAGPIPAAARSGPPTSSTSSH